MKIISFYCRLICLMLYFLFISHQANADPVHVAGIWPVYALGDNVGIGSLNPGQTLDVQGTVRALGYVNSLSLVTTASPSAASSFTINNLSPGTFYRLLIIVQQNTTSGDLELQFNSDTGNNYYWSVGYLATLGGFFVGQGNGVGEIGLTYITQNIVAGSYGVFVLDFTTAPGNNNEVLLTNNNYYLSDPGSQRWSASPGGGTYVGSSILSSLTVFTSAGTITGNAYLYKYN